MKQEYKPYYEKFGLNVVYYRKRKRLTQRKTLKNGLQTTSATAMWKK